MQVYRLINDSVALRKSSPRPTAQGETGALLHSSNTKACVEGWGQTLQLPLGRVLISFLPKAKSDRYLAGACPGHKNHLSLRAVPTPSPDLAPHRDTHTQAQLIGQDWSPDPSRAHQVLFLPIARN